MAVEAIAKVPCITAEVKSETTAAVTEENQNCDSKVCVSKTDVGDTNKALYAQVKRYGNLFAKDASSNESSARFLVCKLRDVARECDAGHDCWGELCDLVESLKQLGTEALPEVIRMLQSGEFSFEGLSSFCEVLMSMGPDAAPAMDVLIAIMEGDRNIEHNFHDFEDVYHGFARVMVNASCLHVFDTIGPAAAPAVPAIIRLMIEWHDNGLAYVNNDALIGEVKIVLTDVGQAAIPAINETLEDEDLDSRIKDILRSVLNDINSAE